MKTITVQIGNSDNKLTQSQWKDYCNSIHLAIKNWSDDIHFSAPSVGWADWQNACWVFACDDSFIKYLKERLSEVRGMFMQDSLAITIGETDFI